MDASLERDLRKRFSAFVSRRGTRMATLIATINTVRERGWTAFAFGGTPRGVYDNGRRYRPRDLDLVFDDEHFLSFESAFEHHVVRHNSYGGLRLDVNGLSIDAWPLAATWAFRERLVKDVSFENLPATTFLNIDGIVVEVTPAKGRQRRVFEKGFFSGWKDKTMDINLLANPYPSICVARTLTMSKRFGFRLSRRLANYVYDMLQRISMSAFERAQLKHYGRIEFEAQMLRGIQICLERHLSSSSLFPVALFPVQPEQLELRSNMATYPTKQSAPVELRETRVSLDQGSFSLDSAIEEQDAFVDGLVREVIAA